MRRCGGDEELSVCRCGGSTVFEGAVIGQVFTGNVQMLCPQATHTRNGSESKESGRSMSAALTALAIWQIVYPPSFLEAFAGSPLPQAIVFFVAGVAARHPGGTLLRWIYRRIPRAE